MFLPSPVPNGHVGNYAGHRPITRSRQMTFPDPCPVTVNLPSLNSISASAASSICAAMILPLAITLSKAFDIAVPPTASEREPYVPMPKGVRSESPWTISTASICARQACRKQVAQRLCHGPDHGYGCLSALKWCRLDPRGQQHFHIGQPGHQAHQPRQMAQCHKPRYRC